MDFNNLESLTRLGSIVQILAIVLVFLGGALQISKFCIDKKVNVIKDQNTRAEKAESQLIISDLKSTMNEQVQKIDQQSKQIESYQKKLNEVESKTKPRVISEERLVAIRSELSKHRGDSIEVTCVMGDQEAFSFASQLKSIFELSGWTVDGVNQSIYSIPIKGIILTLKNESAKQKAEYIFRLLDSGGFKSRGEMNPQIKFDVGIVIGSRE